MSAGSGRLFRLHTCPNPGLNKERPLSMPSKIFTSGRIKKAEWDSSSHQLELHWEKNVVMAYKQVPEEVFRRLCNAPNPATYWEDRIAEEYPKGTPKKSSETSDAALKFQDLFGGPDQP